STSDNSLFNIGFLVGLDFSIVKKIQMMREKKVNLTHETTVHTKIHKNTLLIINGMLDDNDDIEFQKFNKIYIPILKNPGRCKIDHYREVVNGFLINILYSNENLEYVKKCNKDKHSLNDNSLIQDQENEESEI